MSDLKMVTLRLNPDDNVVVVLRDLEKGSEIPDEGISCVHAIPAGHKLSAAVIKQGEPIRKYGQIIGFASRHISCGEHVHTHNVSMGDVELDYAFGVDALDTSGVASEFSTFDGI
ncbi:MAG: UxaA family hydrolase, partial [Desulfobacterales bacterium]